MHFRKRIVFVFLLSIFLLTFTLIADEGHNPDWPRFKPDLILSKEGFRGVKWLTRVNEFPYKMKSYFPAMCYLRVKEDYNVFGTKARYITYTMRNNLFYGVRVDIMGRNRMEKAYKNLLNLYKPVIPVKNISKTVKTFETKYTRVWVEFPKYKSGLGTIYLWGIDRRMFPDDSKTPLYLQKAPQLVSVPRPYVPRSYVIYRKTAEIKIDGDINEKAWQDADWLDRFIDHQAPYSPPPWKTTRIKIVYDDDYIYVAAQLQEENVWGHLTKRDSVAYFDNDFEVFLDPTADGVNYFEFELNPLNMMFDMWHEVDNHRGAYADPVFDSKGLRSVVKVHGTLNYHYDIDKDWTVEMKIPLKELKQWNPDMHYPIRRGDIWRINSSRVQYMHSYTQLFPYLVPYLPCEDWVLNPTDTGDLHVPELWAKAIFSDRYSGDKDVELLKKIKRKVLRTPPPRKRIKGMVYLKGGVFTIGPDPKDPEGHSPAHKVKVPSFWMDRYEVTVKEYTEFLNKGGNDKYYSPWMMIPERCGIRKIRDGKYKVVPGRENYPVVYVSQKAAIAYCKSLGKELPTEEMWERAARGKKGRKYPWGNSPITPEKANYDFYYGGTIPVGSLPAGATPEGIYDLAGNVKEWTKSMFKPYPNGKPFMHRWIKYWFGDHPKIRWWAVSRGGGWTTQPSNMESARRDGQGFINGGFRCVKVDEKE